MPDTDRPLQPLVVDYILFITADVNLDVNPNECSDVAWVSRDELRSMFDEPGKPVFTLLDYHRSLIGPSHFAANHFTPWFKLIVNRFLYPWWDQLLGETAQAKEGASTATKLNGIVDAHVLKPVGEAEGGKIYRMV